MKRFLLDPVRSFVTLAVMLVLTAGVATTVAILSTISMTSPAIERVIRWWARLWFRLSGIELEIRGSFDESQSYVVVSNHSSWLDIFANFLATPVPLRFLAKAELFRIPILAQGMRAIGMIKIDRSKAAFMHEWINEQAKSVAGRAQSIMVYPEGTRTRDGNMQRFKVGAFVIAIENGLPVLPVTIAGSYDAFPSDGMIMHSGRKVLVEIGEPIPTADLGKESIRSLAGQTQDLIATTRYHLDTELT